MQRASTAACACDALQVRLYPDVSHTLTAMYPVPDWHYAWAFTHGRQVCDVCDEACPSMCDPLLSDSEPFTRSHGRYHWHELQQLFPDGRQCWLRFMCESLIFSATGLVETCSHAVPSVSRRLSLTSCCADSEGASDDWNKAMWAGQHPCPPVPNFRSLLRRSSNGSIVPGALSVSVSGSSDHLHLLLLEASTLWLNCHSRSCSSSLGSTSALLPLRLLCV